MKNVFWEWPGARHGPGRHGVGLGHDDAMRSRPLRGGLFELGDRRTARGVEGRQHRDPQAMLGKARELAQHRSGHRKPAGLQHDAPQRSRGARSLHAEQPVDREGEVAAGLAADAAVRQHGDWRVAAALVQDHAVEADLARLVDDHGGIGCLRTGQEVTQERRLAGPEKAGQDDEIGHSAAFFCGAAKRAGTSSSQLAFTSSRTSASSSAVS